MIYHVLAHPQQWHLQAIPMKRKKLLQKLQQPSLVPNTGLIRLSGNT